jgi:hypothetical protein
LSETLGTLVQEFSRMSIKCIGSPHYFVWKRIWILRKEDKKLGHQRRRSFSDEQPATPFDHKRNEEILKELKVESDGEKLRKYEDDLEDV